MNNTIFIIIVVFSLLLNIIIAFYKNKNISYLTYFADPDNHNSLVISLSISGTIIGGGMFLAVGQIGYEAGTLGYVLGIIYFVGLSIIGFFSTKIRAYLDSGNHNSLIELLESSYGRHFTLQFCFINLAMYVFLLAAQFTALNQFASFTQSILHGSMIPWYLVCLTVIIIFIYPIIGGLRKDIITDIFQVILIFIASLIIIWKVYDSSVYMSFWNNLSHAQITGTGYGILFLLGSIIFLTPSFLIRMDMWQRIRSSRDSDASKKGFIYAGIISAFFYFFFSTLGMLAYTSKLNGPKYATLELILYLFQNPFLLAIIMGSFFAAVLSSADTFINVSSVFMTRLVFPDLWQKKDQMNFEKKLLLRSRIIGFVLVIIALFLAFTSSDFVDLLVGAFSLILIFLPSILGLFLESWRNKTAANWSSGISFAIFCSLFFFWNPKLAFAPAVLISFILYSGILASHHRTTIQNK